jgi:glycosyltransferase involved in cell wall biosynthesis
MPTSVQISVVIITFNEEKNIARCIDSVYEVADEILVVDSYSTDRTKEICLHKKVRFIEHSFKGHIEQKNYAVSQATYPYILSLDADEELSDKLAASIKSVKNNWRKDAYTMNRLSSFSGKWIRHCGWYPNRKIRLWDSRKGRWGGYNPHDKLIMEKKSAVGHLKGDLLHYAYRNTSELLAKLQRYSSIYAHYNRFKKKSSPFKIFYKSSFAFFRSYILRTGFLEGYEGFLISASIANDVFYKYAKLYEVNKQLSTCLIITSCSKDALEVLLQSILHQSEMPNEIIVADNGFSSETEQLMKVYARKFSVPLLHCRSEGEDKLAELKNKALVQANAEYILMVDGDAVLSRDFIKNHKKAAWKKCFVQGPQAFLSETLTQQAIARKITYFPLFGKGLNIGFSAVEIPFLSPLFSTKTHHVKEIHGSNLAFWKEDAIQVNGFNEGCTGEHIENSEFAIRLVNNDIKKINLRFGGVMYQLFHSAHTSRELKSESSVLQKSISEQMKYCEQGINQHMLLHKDITVNE